MGKKKKSAAQDSKINNSKVENTQEETGTENMGQYGSVQQKPAPKRFSQPTYTSTSTVRHVPESNEQCRKANLSQSTISEQALPSSCYQEQLSVSSPEMLQATGPTESTEPTNTVDSDNKSPKETLTTFTENIETKREDLELDSQESCITNIEGGKGSSEIKLSIDTKPSVESETISSALEHKQQETEVRSVDAPQIDGDENVKQQPDINQQISTADSNISPEEITPEKKPIIPNQTTESNQWLPKNDITTASQSLKSVSPIDVNMDQETKQQHFVADTEDSLNMTDNKDSSKTPTQKSSKSKNQTVTKSKNKSKPTNIKPQEESSKSIQAIELISNVDSKVNENSMHPLSDTTMPTNTDLTQSECMKLTTIQNQITIMPKEQSAQSDIKLLENLSDPNGNANLAFQLDSSVVPGVTKPEIQPSNKQMTENATKSNIKTNTIQELPKKELTLIEMKPQTELSKCSAMEEQSMEQVSAVDVPVDSLATKLNSKQISEEASNVLENIQTKQCTSPKLVTKTHEATNKQKSASTSNKNPKKSVKESTGDIQSNVQTGAVNSSVDEGTPSEKNIHDTTKMSKTDLKQNSTKKSLKPQHESAIKLKKQQTPTDSKPSEEPTNVKEANNEGDKTIQPNVIQVSNNTVSVPNKTDFKEITTQKSHTPKQEKTTKSKKTPTETDIKPEEQQVPKSEQMLPLKPVDININKNVKHPNIIQASENIPSVSDKVDSKQTTIENISTTQQEKVIPMKELSSTDLLTEISKHNLKETQHTQPVSTIIPKEGEDIAQSKIKYPTEDIPNMSTRDSNHAIQKPSTCVHPTNVPKEKSAPKDINSAHKESLLQCTTVNPIKDDTTQPQHVLEETNTDKSKLAKNQKKGKKRQENIANDITNNTEASKNTHGSLPLSATDCNEQKKENFSAKHNSVECSTKKSECQKVDAPETLPNKGVTNTIKQTEQDKDQVQVSGAGDFPNVLRMDLKENKPQKLSQPKQTPPMKKSQTAKKDTKPPSATPKYNTETKLLQSVNTADSNVSEGACQSNDGSDVTAKMNSNQKSSQKAAKTSTKKRQLSEKNIEQPELSTGTTHSPELVSTVDKGTTVSHDINSAENDTTNKSDSKKKRKRKKGIQEITNEGKISGDEEVKNIQNDKQPKDDKDKVNIESDLQDLQEFKVKQSKKSKNKLNKDESDIAKQNTSTYDGTNTASKEIKRKTPKATKKQPLAPADSNTADNQALEQAITVEHDVSEKTTTQSSTEPKSSKKKKKQKGNQGNANTKGNTDSNTFQIKTPNETEQKGSNKATLSTDNVTKGDKGIITDVDSIKTDKEVKPTNLNECKETSSLVNAPKSKKCNRKKKNTVVETDIHEKSGNEIDMPAANVSSETKKKPKFETEYKQPRSLTEDLVIDNQQREQRIHSILRKKLLERAEEKIRNEISSASISASEQSERYIDQLTKNLKFLTGSGEGPKVDWEDAGCQLLNSSNPSTTHIGEQEEELEYRVVQRVIFQSYACHICKTLGGKQSAGLKKCIQCKMISYCSKEHQKEHWPLHKDMCRAICKLCKCDGTTHLFEKALGLSPDCYRHYRIHYVNECTKELGRELELWEKEMFYYAEVCHTCYECDRNKLTQCEKCSHVSYCKPEHLQSNHSNWCKDFKLYGNIVRHQAQHGMIMPLLPTTICNQYRTLSDNMKRHISEIISVSEQPDHMNYAVLTDIATCPLTVVFALQHCYSSLESMLTLTVHMVGAEIHFEADTLKKWEVFILHFIPNINMLRIVFVGPELQVDGVPQAILDQGKCCQQCVTRGRKVVFDFCPRLLYHEYTTSEKYCHPDLICALNAGLYRPTGFAGRDTWPLTIEAMLKNSNIPVVVTAYTADEIPLDVARMQEYCSLKIVLPPIENPFSSSKPSLNFVTEEKVPVIFKNFYIAIMKGAGTKGDTETK